jgi:hypothetical protein
MALIAYKDSFIETPLYLFCCARNYNITQRPLDQCLLIQVLL